MVVLPAVTGYGLGARPLEGLRVAVTRRGTVQPDRLAELLDHAGARPIEAPLTSTLPPEDPLELGRAVVSLYAFNWLVVTSAQTVTPLCEALETAGIRVDSLREDGLRVCAVGPRTGAMLSKAGLEPDLIPERFCASGVVDALLELGDPRRLKVFFPRAEEGREMIPWLLREAGAEVVTATAYRTVLILGAGTRLSAQVDAGKVDALTFTAGSAARVFSDAWARRRTDAAGEAGARLMSLPTGTRVIALGPATASALESGGVRVDRIAYPHTLEGLVASLQDCYLARDT